MARTDNLRRARAFRRGWSRRHQALGLDRRVFLRPEGKRATLTTAMAGTNNDLLISAFYRGAEGNSIRVRVVVAGVSTVQSVAVSGLDITFNSATNGASAATSTGAQMLAALNADPAASKLIFAQLAAGNDGTGVVAAFAFTNLTGGQ